MFPAGAVVVVLAGVAVGRLVNDVPWRWAGAAVALALTAALVPSALNHVRDEHRDLREQRARTQQIKRLAGKVSAVGGASLLRSCGEPLTRLEFQTILAWTLELNVNKVGFKYGPAEASRRAIVLFTPTPHGGWVLQALHQRSPACRRLPS
jgi:divalent metal cation (Fe/Co/Zn/Cd) transporter